MRSKEKRRVKPHLPLSMVISMKNVYIDTDILIAAFKPEDIFFESSRKIYSKLGVDYEGCTSPLSLVEIAGVISTRLSEFPTELIPIKMRKKLQNLSPDETAILITHYIADRRFELLSRAE